MNSTSGPGTQSWRGTRLRAGDWVVVRPAEEILATLDERGCLDGLPFQPEMLDWCGQRMKVRASAHKTCDTVAKTGGRSMNDAVHLEGSRCNGKAHGGCQADCSFFWKEQWLLPDGAGSRRPRISEGSRASPRYTLADLERATRREEVEADGDETWVCQATRLLDATQPLSGRNARQYLRDVTSGNWRAWDLAKVLMFAGYRQLLALGIGYRALTWAYEVVRRRIGGLPLKREGGPIPVGQPTPAEDLNLQPGELVEVKALDEILPTLNERSLNRGMRFDKEMAAYCGQRFRVLRRVDRIIDEATGKMVVMKTPCIQLEGTVCRALCSAGRLGCPRAIQEYWREIWLRRVA